MVHELKLHPEPFELIRSGNKIIESRLWDEKRQQIEVGDTLMFKRRPDFIEVVKGEVVELLRYGSFEELFGAYPVELFGQESRQKLMIAIRKYYSPEKEQQYGVVGIKFRLI